MVERDLAERRLACLASPEFDPRGSYGFIFRRNRSLSPAALAYMQAVRDVEQRIVEREAELEQMYGQRPGWHKGGDTVKQPAGA